MGKTAKKCVWRKMRIHRLAGFCVKHLLISGYGLHKEERRIERLYLVRKYTIKLVNKVEVKR